MCRIEILELTEEQAAESQKATTATQVVINVRAAMIDTASKKIFELIQKS